VPQEPGEHDRDDERAQDREEPATGRLKPPREWGIGPAPAHTVALEGCGALARGNLAGPLLYGVLSCACFIGAALGQQAWSARGQHR
jgi:hypothetical protein